MHIGNKVKVFSSFFFTGGSRSYLFGFFFSIQSICEEGIARDFFFWQTMSFCVGFILFSFDFDFISPNGCV